MTCNQLGEDFCLLLLPKFWGSLAYHTGGAGSWTRQSFQLEIFYDSMILWMRLWWWLVSHCMRNRMMKMWRCVTDPFQHSVLALTCMATQHLVFLKSNTSTNSPKASSLGEKEIFDTLFSVDYIHSWKGKYSTPSWVIWQWLSNGQMLQ